MEGRKIRSDLELILEGQKINQGFIGLATQNQELLDLNSAIGNRCRRIECAEKRTGSKLVQTGSAYPSVPQ